MPWHQIYRFTLLAGILGLVLITAMGWRRNAPVITQYVQEIQQSHLELEQAQKQLIVSQAKQQELLERIVGLQAQFVESMEIELFFLSKPQHERPEYPLPQGLRRRFAPGYQPD
jgi:hypothetical protein